MTITTNPNSLLHGGPVQIADDDRLRWVPDHQDVVKLPWGNGYEHFVRTGERTRRWGREVRLFTWSHRTYLAE